MANILICTGIFPPAIGGPAQYAKEVRDALIKQGNNVHVLTYKHERKLPPLVRHELFFWRTLLRLRGVDFVLALDTFSVGWPAAVAASLLRKKIVIRTGGDFLWEAYVERTGKKVLFKDFYETCRSTFTRKERFIFEVTRWTVQHATKIIFSTEWQRDIWMSVYDLKPEKCRVVENFYGTKIGDITAATTADKKVFVAGTRQLVWKNLDTLSEAFAIAQKSRPELVLDKQTAPYEQFLAKIQNAYAVVLASLGDISPNMILDAIRCNTPFILTQENGLIPRIKDIAVFCDPKNPHDIAEKILWFADEKNYQMQKEKIRAFSFVHSWDDIAREIIATLHERH